MDYYQVWVLEGSGEWLDASGNLWDLQEVSDFIATQIEDYGFRIEHIKVKGVKMVATDLDFNYIPPQPAIVEIKPL